MDFPIFVVITLTFKCGFKKGVVNAYANTLKCQIVGGEGVNC